MLRWAVYQEQVAEFFRSLGCLATINAKIRGARATHAIDVWVEFKRFGVEHRWVIECKAWRKPIMKEKVLTLRGVVEDVGADRGVMVTDIGFQRGARAAAERTNILLTTFVNLRERAQGDLIDALAAKGQRRA